MSERYLVRNPSAESTVTFLPFGSTLVFTSLTLTLKVFVKAKGFSETEQMLHQFKEALPPDAFMSHLNIKTPKDNDWFAQGSVLG
jgi:hypothetical protein